MNARVTTEDARRIAAALEDGDAQAIGEASRALLSLASERDRLKQLDTEAATYVETLICTRTDCSGDPPYVGWKGLGLALAEALDERDALKAAAVQPRPA